MLKWRDMPARKGLFVVLEGPDKSGKSTQAKLLADLLRGRGVAVLHTREPGGTAVAEGVRKLLLDPALRVSPRAELFLYEASRAQHVEEKIRPALERGEFVLCERFTMSSAVYQGFARGLDSAMIDALNDYATGGLKPDLTVVLDIPSGEFDSRDLGRELDRLEREDEAFRRRVRDGYRALAAATPGVALLDGRRPQDELQRDILSRVEALSK